VIAKQYRLRCLACSTYYTDDGFMLQCGKEHEPAFLVTEYDQRNFECDPHFEGIYRYKSWLPIQRILPCTGNMVTYQSEHLCEITGLPNLWITFNGYWPEKGAGLETATFKELEAYTALSRIPKNYNRVLVVSSAGNTAAAFAQLCSRHRIPCLIIMPSSGWHKMQFPEPLDPCVKLVLLKGFVAYYDAIVLAERITCLPGFQSEGGAKNVARRDGLGTTILNAVETIGRLPDYYFQAIGSGCGGIAAHTMAMRLVQDGRFGHKLPKLMLSQNAPFAPIYYAWKLQKRELVNRDENEQQKQIRQIIAQVLSNQNPPYAIKGGVFDALMESQGDMLIANNHEVKHAMHLFSELEGIDIDPAAAVALATLLNTTRCKRLDRDAYTLLNITGGGWKRRQQDSRMFPANPTLQIEDDELRTERALQKIVALF